LTTAPINSSVCRQRVDRTRAGKTHRYLGRRVTVRGVDDRVARDVEFAMRGNGADFLLGANEDRGEQALPCRIHRATQGALIARMNHATLHRFESLTPGNQALVFLVLVFHRLRLPGASRVDAPLLRPGSPARPGDFVRD
jgi:hypothetical protein